MSIPSDANVQTAGVRLSIDEATVLLGLLDLLQPGANSDPAIEALTDRTRARLAGAIAQSLSINRGDGLHAV